MKKKKIKNSNEVACWCCNKKGLYNGDCYERNHKEANKKGQSIPGNSGRGRGLHGFVKEIIIAPFWSEAEQGMKFSAWQPFT